MAWEGDGEGLTWLSRPLWQICKMVNESAAFRLEPYLRTLPGLEPSSLLWVLSGAMAPSTPGTTTIISQEPWENFPRRVFLHPTWLDI